MHARTPPMTRSFSAFSNPPMSAKSFDPNLAFLSAFELIDQTLGRDRDWKGRTNLGHAVKARGEVSRDVVLRRVRRRTQIAELERYLLLVHEILSGLMSACMAVHMRRRLIAKKRCCA